MPMMLLVETDGGISEFVMKPIDRKTRQAVTKRLAMDSHGRECGRAMLTHDGLLLQSGSTTDLYEDADGNSVEHGEVMATAKLVFSAHLRKRETIIARFHHNCSQLHQPQVASTKRHLSVAQHHDTY